MSGWNDDKGSPMGVVSPDGGSDGGGGGGGGNRVTMAVMTVALLFSVVVAAYSLYMLNTSRGNVNTVYETKLKEQGDELKKVRDDLAKARANDEYYRNYALLLEEDNAYIETYRRPKWAFPPEPPPPQKYIDYLRKDNELLRGRKPRLATANPPRNPWPPAPVK